MAKTPIPERLPIGDSFTGTLVERDGKFALASSPLEDINMIYTGDMIIRYGIRYMGKPQVSVVPGLVVLDYGKMLNGEAAWEFVTKKSNLYPRAEVFGFRNDGKDEMIVVKALDLALPFAVLAYADATAPMSIAQPSALIMSEAELDTLPDRLKNVLAHFKDVKDWLAIPYE
jgi:hypothetical protein